MSKKVYAPGEMFHDAWFGTVRNWNTESNEWKHLFVVAEKRMFNLLSQQCKEDEQTDDNPGVPLNDYSHD